MPEEAEHPAATSPVALAWVPCAGELGRPVAITTAAKMPPPRGDAIGCRLSLLRGGSQWWGALGRLEEG